MVWIEIWLGSSSKAAYLWKFYPFLETRHAIPRLGLFPPIISIIISIKSITFCVCSSCFATFFFLQSLHFMIQDHLPHSPFPPPDCYLLSHSHYLWSTPEMRVHRPRCTCGRGCGRVSLEENDLPTFRMFFNATSATSSTTQRILFRHLALNTFIFRFTMSQGDVGLVKILIPFHHHTPHTFLSPVTEFTHMEATGFILP